VAGARADWASEGIYQLELRSGDRAEMMASQSWHPSSESSLVRDEGNLILVTNDDGCDSIGVQRVARRLQEVADICLVVPDIDQSGASHALTTRTPLNAKERLLVPGLLGKVVSKGTPADCVYLGVCYYLSDRQPSLVVSGVNLGYNLADDIPYSGTVAAAREASLLDIPAIAISAESFSGATLETATLFAAELAMVVRRSPALLPAGTFLNVNVPDSSGLRFQVTSIGRRRYSRDVRRVSDPRAKEYLWIGGDALKHDDIEGSDCNAVLDHRRISVTPMRFSGAAVDLLNAWREVTLPSFGSSA
jgi:5'-nucleotidase